MTFRPRDWYGIPERMHPGIVRYIERGIPPGHFLQALLSNDLMETLARGDDENVDLLRDYGRFLYNQCPSNCYGSAATYAEWIKAGGLYGEEVHGGFTDGRDFGP